jgi:hypothetical protein
MESDSKPLSGSFPHPFQITPCGASPRTTSRGVGLGGLAIGRIIFPSSFLLLVAFFFNSNLWAIENVTLVSNPDYEMGDEAGGALANTFIIRVGSFAGLSDEGIGNLLTGDLATVRSNLNSYFATGQTASTNKLWGSTTYNTVFNAGLASLNRASTTNFAGFPVFVLVFNSTSITNATQAGIYCFLNSFDGQRLAFPEVDSGAGADLEFFSTNVFSGMRPFLGSLGGDKVYRLVTLGNGFGITSTNAYAALVDSEVSYRITANHGATNFSATGLPAGLSVDAASGDISGSVSSAGVYSNITLQAAGLAGTRTSSLTLTVSAPLPGTPQITSSTNAQTATAGVAYSFLVTANNTPTGYQAAGLPLGLSLDSASGLISGTPSLPGTYSVVIGGSNAVGPGRNSKFTLSVVAPSLVYSNTAFQLGVSSNSPAPVPTAGYTPSSYRKPAGGNWDQVPGLDLDMADGRILGTPTRAFAPVTLTVESLDALGVVGSGLITVSSATAKPLLSSTNRVEGLTFSPIAYNLTATVTNTTVAPGLFKLLRTSNSTTTNWVTATNTTVLPGVTLNESTGALSGSPSQGGTFLAEFAADNSTAKSSEGYPGEVFGGGLGTPLQTTFVIDVTPPSLPNLSDASVYLTMTNGIGEVRDYASMPVGMTRNFDVANSLATFTTFSNVPAWLRMTTNTSASGSFATLSGKATQAGTFTVLKLAQNTNVAGVTQATNRELVITVIGSLPTAASIGFQAPPPGQVGSSYTGYITTAENLRDPAHPSAFNATGLPPGISFASAADRQLGKLTGTPTTAGTYTVKFYIANARGYTTQTSTMTILP